MGLSFKTTELPTVIDDDPAQRRALTFSVEGLAAREEMLFKGYVRLLDHLTEHQWQHREPTTLHRIDLLVANEHVRPTQFLQASNTLQPILKLGANNHSNSPYFLSWPLKPKELENQLNSLGRLICGDVASQQSVSKAGVEAGADTDVGGIENTTPAALQVEADPAPPPDRCFRLRQWPKPMLLAESGRMRLATLITGRAMSLAELVFRTGLPTLVCERFLADMETAGLIVHPDSEASQAPVWVAPPPRKPRPPAVLERQVAVAAATKPVVQMGLLSRIRLRLGIKSFSSL